ncbi:MAG: PIG-L family deacetylase [Victivallaceae bacterium]|nr:PIG-L family deacetylase [Victivallaceae bacterium]
MEKEIRRFLMIGAHPDDADIRFGGTAVQLVRAGHIVKFVSCCNGSCGHFEMSGKELVERRFLETQRSREVSGISEYQVLKENNDCELTPSLENRAKVVRIIRAFKPDVVLTHRLCDYHADHRATAQLVLDSAYLTQVPMYCRDTPIPPKNPVFGHVYDDFTEPRPLRTDAIIPIDDALDDKCRMLDCHVSQVYEWLAWELGEKIDHASWSWEQKREFLVRNWGKRFVNAANHGRNRLIQVYGERGKEVRYAEAFELSPLGRAVSADEFQALMTP